MCTFPFPYGALKVYEEDGEWKASFEGEEVEFQFASRSEAMTFAIAAQWGATRIVNYLGVNGDDEFCLLKV